MQVEPILIIDTFYGKLTKRGKFYFRRNKNGQVHACKCPDRRGHTKTEGEAANQKKFARTWGQRYKKS